MLKRAGKIKKHNKICIKCGDDHTWIMLENDCHAHGILNA